MDVKFVMIMAVIFSVVSCEKNVRPVNGVTQQTERQPETSEVVDSARLFEGNDLEEFPITGGTVINADCDYYDKYGEHLGRLQRGQEIVFIGSYYYYIEDIGVVTEVATAINKEQIGTPIYVAEKYITFLDGERYDFWFKNKLLTQEYYYTETVEYIFNYNYEESIRKHGFDRKTIIARWSNFYTERILHISDNHFAMGNDAGVFVFRLESVAQNGNIYTLLLSDRRGELEVTLIDDGNGIIISQCVARNEHMLENFVKLALNLRYVPYDSVKSQRTKDAVMAWCNSQLSGGR